NVGFRLFAQPMPQRVPPEFEPIIWLMFGYALSQKPDLKERVQEILAEIEDPALRERMEGNLDLGLLTRQAENLLAHENDSVTAEELKTIASLFNGDLDHPGPSELVTGGERAK